MRSSTPLLVFVIAFASCTNPASGNLFGGGLTSFFQWPVVDPTPLYKPMNYWQMDKPTARACPTSTCACTYQEGVQYGGQPMATTVLSPSDVGTEARQCCEACKSTKKCRFWQLERSTDQWNANSLWSSWKMSSSKCTLFDACADQSYGGWGWCGWLDNSKRMSSWGKQTYGGGLCEGEVKNDPHLLGAQGTQYDFNGVPDENFCLISDAKYAINMHLSGYYDTNVEGATTLATPGSDDKKSVRTWIRELGFVWLNEGDGTKHTLRMAARRGTESGIKRGPGFMEAIELDGDLVSIKEPGHSYASKGANITMLPFETHGPMDIDVFDVRIEGIMDVTLRLRAAIPKFQLKNEAGEVVDTEVHINLEIRTLNNSPTIHGVLGQTYRADHSQRADIFKKKVRELGGPIQADGESGKGFLDGETMDYKLDSLFSTNWKYSIFKETGDKDNNVQVDL